MFSRRSVRYEFVYAIVHYPRTVTYYSAIQKISSLALRNQSHLFTHSCFSFVVFKMQTSHYIASLNGKTDFILFVESSVNVI